MAEGGIVLRVLEAGDQSLVLLAELSAHQTGLPNNHHVLQVKVPADHPGIQKSCSEGGAYSGFEKGGGYVWENIVFFCIFLFSIFLFIFFL